MRATRPARVTEQEAQRPHASDQVAEVRVRDRGLGTAVVSSWKQRIDRSHSNK